MNIKCLKTGDWCFEASSYESFEEGKEYELSEEKAQKLINAEWAEEWGPIVEKTEVKKEKKKDKPKKEKKAE